MVKFRVNSSFLDEAMLLLYSHTHTHTHTQFTFISLCVWWGHARILQHACGDWETCKETGKSWFSISIMWIPRIKLGSSGLVTRVFTFWATLLIIT